MQRFLYDWGKWCGSTYGCAVFKLLQFMDRGVQNGSPIEFDAFIQRTTNNTAHTASLFGMLGSLYTIGTVIGCCGAALRVGEPAIL